MILETADFRIAPDRAADFEAAMSELQHFPSLWQPHRHKLGE